MRRRAGAAVVCLLQDEDVWLDALPPTLRSEAETELARRAADADRLIAITRTYADRISRRLALPANRVAVVPPVIQPPPGPPAPLPDRPPVLGYYARLIADRGLDDAAWRLLRHEPGLAALRLRLGAGAAASDRPHLRRLLRSFTAAERAGSIVETDHDHARRWEFYRAISVLSTPARVEDGGGLQSLEAMALGMPVVQPDRGAFGEIVRQTGGGLVYFPQTPEALAAALAPLLWEPERLRELGRIGRAAVAGMCDPNVVSASWLAEFEAAISTRRSDRA